MPSQISPKSRITRAKSLVTLATESVCLEVTLAAESVCLEVALAAESVCLEVALATESVCLGLQYDVCSCSHEFLVVLRRPHELRAGGGLTPILIGVRDVPYFFSWKKIFWVYFVACDEFLGLILSLE